MTISDTKMNRDKSSKATWMQLMLGVITNLTNLSLGACLGFTAIALPIMQNSSGPDKITTDQASWIASSTSISIPIGCIISGPLLDNIGRKRTLYLVNIIAFIGWIFIASAPKEPSTQYILLLIGRVITGISTGVGSIPATVYLSEISTPQWRGMLATWTSVFVAIGVLIMYILGYFLQDSWRTTAIITIFLPVVSILSIYFLMPESPSWLVNQNRIELAEKNLSRIRCIGITSPNLKEEIELLVANKIKNRDNQLEGLSFRKRFLRKFRYLLTPVCLKPFLIMVTFFFFQQASGTFVIVFYAVSIVEEAGVPKDYTYIAAILIALSRVIASILVGMVCKRYGRRPPTIISGAVMTICMVTLSGYLYTIHLNMLKYETVTKLNWLPAFLLIFYFFTSTFGFLTIPFAMIAEMFPTRVRGLAGGLTACLCYIFNFIFVKVYNTMIETMGKHGVFGFYGGMALFGTIFVAIFLPETKGKTLQEIEDYFNNGRRGRRKVTEKTELKV